MARSTKAEIRASLERIEAILQEHPEGLDRAQIRDALGTRYDEDLADRTLRRRLLQLEDEGRLVRAGKSRATRYHATDGGAEIPRLTDEGSGDEPNTLEQAERGAEAAITLSVEGLEVQRLIRLPAPGGHQRNCVQAQRNTADHPGVL